MDLNAKISLGTFVSKHFTWGEALKLPSWNIYHNPDIIEIHKIVYLASVLDQVREILGVPLSVDCWIRPTVPMSRLIAEVKPHVTPAIWAEIEKAGGSYNEFIGGAKLSMHREGAAADLKPSGKTVDECLAILKPKADELKIRLENNGESMGRAWVHVDTLPVPPGETRVVGPGSTRRA